MAIPSAGWTLREMRLRQWVLTHPGACKDISVRCKVSAEYVRLVLYGKRSKVGAGSQKAQQIVRMLKSKGCPI